MSLQVRKEGLQRCEIRINLRLSDPSEEENHQRPHLRGESISQDYSNGLTIARK